tara:strand:- start:292 stop:534 length:243 start_codon:yes stop_codon:yes gene_type:complete
MARKQKPNYGDIHPKILLSTRTNWQDVKHPIDSERLDDVRLAHKQSVYVQEMREQWLSDQRKRDEQFLINRDLDLLSELC